MTDDATVDAEGYGPGENPAEQVDEEPVVDLGDPADPDGPVSDWVDKVEAATGIRPADDEPTITFDPDGPAIDAAAAELGSLTGGLCRAVGLDPAQVAGFRLTVQGGAYPTLEVWHLPPARDGNLLDTWVAPLADRMADTTIAVLPGAGATLPPAAARPDPGRGFEVPAELMPEQWLAQHLPMILDVVNGAPVDGDTRDALTALGHRVADDMTRRVYAARGVRSATQVPSDG